MLFNTRMVKAILEGRKTVTRRLMRPEEAWACENNGDLHFRVQKGDVLWVRETWAFWPCVTCGERDTCAEKPASMETADGETEGCFLYRADGETPIFRSGQIWRPSIHMPRQAARIFLQVTEVRAERLRESIFEAKRPPMAEFYNEGVADDADHTNCSNCKVLFGAPECRGKDSKCVPIQKTSEKFARLWDSTVPKDKLEELGWAADPWVWVIRFERCEAPGS